MFKQKIQKVAFSAAVALAFSGSAFADYYIIPYVGFSTGETINGYDLNGDTSGTVGFTDAARTANATVDLSTGSLKGFAQQTVTGNSFFNAIMGDVITIRGGAGTDWNVQFNLDGSISASKSQGAPGYPSTTSVGYYYDFAVYKFGEAGINANNWFLTSNMDKALAHGSKSSLPVIGTDSPSPAGSIDEVNSRAVPVVSNNDTFLIYARIFGTASADYQSGLTSSTVDMSHTAQFGFQVADNVDIYSESGAFLGYGKAPALDSGNVPEPGSLALVVAGLMGLGAVARKRRA